MYLSFYRDIKFETVLNLGQVWPLIADESVRLSYFKQAARLQFTWLS